MALAQCYPCQKEHSRAFRVPFGYYDYEWLRLPQGFRNAASHFSRVMEIIFGNMNLVNLVLYIDDIMLYAKTVVRVLIHTIAKVLKRLIDKGLKVSGKKCQWLQESVTFLGHFVNSKGVAVFSDKIEKNSELANPQYNK